MSDFGTRPHEEEKSADPMRRIEREGRGAREAASDLGGKARHATDALGEKAEAASEQVRQQTSESLSSLAESVRRASDDYRKTEPGLLADLMGQAADGVDTLARTVGGRSTSDMIGTAREFGSRNPVGLLLGGIAAGFAISRLAVGMSGSSGASDGARETPQASASNVSEGDHRHGT